MEKDYIKTKKTHNILAVLDSKDIYGKELSNIEVYKTLQDHGYNITVLYNKYATSRMKKEMHQFNAIPTFLPRNLNGKWRIFNYFTATINANIKLCSLLHKNKNTILLIPTEIALLYLLPTLLLFYNIKIIFRMGDSPIAYRKNDSNILTRIYSWLWKSIILKRVNCVVSISQFIKSKLIEYGRIERKEDVVIYNFPPQRHVITNETINIDKTEDNIIFGYLGRIVEDKGVILLIEATLQLLKENYKISLYIGGNPQIDPTYYAKIEELLKANPHSINIHFLGEITNITSFYKQIDVACTPSIYEEPLGNVIVEAKSFHKPSIIFNKGGMPEIIEHQHNGYICHNTTTESLKQAMLYYIINPQKTITEGKDAYNSINRMGIDKKSYTHKWLNVMESMTINQ